MTEPPDQRLACHENLECLLSANRTDYVHAVAEGAASLPLFQDSLPPDRIVTIQLRRRIRPYLNDCSVIRHSDLHEVLRTANVTGFVPSYRSSSFMESWARRNEIRLVSPPSQVQGQLEEKILFHRFLLWHRLPVPAGFELRSVQQVGQIDTYPLVCQAPRSEGMEGTFLARSRRQLRRLLRERSLKLPLLCREFVEGAVLGITIIVGAHDLILSAVRRQCRALHRRQKDLAGVQWVARSRFTAAQQHSINATMTALGMALAQIGFRGAANVDFILTADRALIIECNPRFSSSTPQISLEPSLLHGLDFITEYRRALGDQRLGGHFPTLPRSSYEGTNVDLSEGIVARLKALRRGLVNAMPRLGVYDIRDGRMEFLSSNVVHLRHKTRALFYFSTPAGQHINKKSDLGSLTTNVPLFDLHRSRLVLSRLGAALIDQLQQNVRFNRPKCSLADLIALHQQQPCTTTSR